MARLIDITGKAISGEWGLIITHCKQLKFLDVLAKSKHCSELEVAA